MSVRVYVEGGGDARGTKDGCREGFRELFKKIVPSGSAPKVIASGPRLKAFLNFCDALRDYPDQKIMLLVDSESPVTTGVWDHLRSRPADALLALIDPAKVRVASPHAALFFDTLARYCAQ